MTAQALPKTQELENKINSLFSKNRRPNDFDIRLLKKEAEKLKGKIEYADYYDFLGQIASLENNRSDIVGYYEKSIKLASSDYDIQHNYMACLENRGLIYQATEQAKNLVRNFSDVPETTIFLIKNITHLCRFRESLQLLNKLEKQEYSLYDTIVDAIAIFENAQLNDDEAQHLCQLAFSVLKTKNLYFSASQINIVDDCVCYTIYVDLPIEYLSDINWELAGVFAENVKDMRSDVLIFEYSSIDILEEKEKYECLI